MKFDDVGVVRQCAGKLKGSGTWPLGHRVGEAGRQVILGGMSEGGLLGGEELADAFFGVVEHLVELGAGVGVLFGGGLGFYEASVGEHDYVHVDGGAGVFFVAEVEEGVAVYDSHGGGGDHLFEGRGFQGAGGY